MENGTSRALDEKRTNELLLRLDGLRYSFGVFNLGGATIRKCLSKFETDFSAPTSEAMRAIGAVWGMIDAAYRIRLLVAHLPLANKSPPVRKFRDATAEIEEFRHYVQHLDKQITTMAQSRSPLWGTLSWTSPTNKLRSLSLVSGTTHIRPSTTSLVFDRVNQEFTRKLQLQVGANTLDLERLTENVRELEDAVIEWSKSIKFSDGTIYAFDQPEAHILLFELTNSIFSPEPQPE